MRQRSLKMKFVSAMSLITVLVLIVTSAVTLAISMRISKDSTETSMEQLVMLGASEVDHWFEEKETLLELVAEEISRFALGEKEAVEAYLERFLQGKYPYLVDIYVTTPDNDMYSGIHFSPEEYVDWHAQYWYYAAVEAGGLVYTRPFVTEDEGNPMVIALSMPVRDRNGDDMGVLAMDIKIESLVDFVNSERVMDTSGRGFLLDEGRNIITHENEEFLPSVLTIGGEARLRSFDSADIDFGKEIRDDGILLTKGKNWNGESTYFATVAIQRNGWLYGFSVPVSDFNRMHRGLIGVWAVVMVGMTAISFWLSGVVAHRLLVPIKAIIKAAGDLALGDMDVRIEVRTGDELEALSHQFRKMIRSNAQQVEAIQRMAEGDFTAHIEPKSEKDVLGITLNSVIDQLRGMLSEISRTAEMFARSAAEISNASEQLAEGAQDQTGAVEELCGSLDGILQHTKANAQNAGTANETISQVRQMADAGSRSMESMVVAVQEIDRSSEDITKIISVIESIAFQTKILSLNAAVEAARAGSHGKGFAVVAGEVRNLAGRCADAVQEITHLIGTTTKKTETGVAIAQETERILLEIAQRINETATAMEEIDGTLDQQVGQIDQITESVEQISGVVQTNSATAQETSAATQEMSVQAQSLQRAMSKFRTGQLREVDGREDEMSVS